MRLRSYWGWAIVICGLFLLTVLSGCETVKGAAKGTKEGLSKDWENVKKADAWMRENLW